MIIVQWFLTGADLWCYESPLCRFFRSQFPDISAVAAGMSGFHGSSARICLEHALAVTARIGTLSGSTTSRRPLGR
jgi:hypothetical protein